VRLPSVDIESLRLDAVTRNAATEIIEENLLANELAARGIEPRTRILIHGSPGNGKTSLACAIATALGLTPYGASFGRLIESYMGATSANLTRLVDKMIGKLVVIDEFDALSSTRFQAESASSKEYNTVVSSMLSLFDRTRNGILVATTNRIDIIDSAILRRFECQIHVPDPSTEELYSFVTYSLGLNHGNELTLGLKSYSDAANEIARVKRAVAINEIKGDLKWE
jgi:SpoVK/Ycf46/Vps4 family AAA+-type ATPase